MVIASTTLVSAMPTSLDSIAPSALVPTIALVMDIAMMALAIASLVGQALNAHCLVVPMTV